MNENFTKFTALVRYSIRRILLSKKIVFLLVGLGFTVAVMGYASTQDVEKLWVGAGLMSGLIISFMVPITTMIYGSTIIQDDIEDRSITQIISSPIDRVLSYLGYYLAIVICLSAMLMAITTAGFISFFGPLGIDSASLSIYIDITALVFIGTLVYSSLFMLVSLMTSKAVYFGLFYAFIWEGFVGSLPGNIQKVAISHYIKSISSSWIEYISLDNASGLMLSFYILFALIVSLISFGCLLFRTKEFP
jgi:ABC-2 type transport system permease protein